MAGIGPDEGLVPLRRRSESTRAAVRIPDSVHVTVPRRVVQPGIIRLLVDADQRFGLTQRERIVFAMLAQTEGLSAVELTERLELADPTALRPWLGRLPEWGLVEQTGRTKATRYFAGSSARRLAHGRRHRRPS